MGTYTLDFDYLFLDRLGINSIGECENLFLFIIIPIFRSLNFINK